MEYSANHLFGPRPFQQLMQRVGIGKGVQYGNPVGKLVLHVKAGHAQSRRIANNARQLNRLRSVPQHLAKGFYNSMGVAC